MYFPYLRGRQYELIAIRELVEHSLLGKHVTPVIEPVKLTSGLTKTMGVYQKNAREIGVVRNPKVGSFRKDLDESDNAKLKDAFYDLLGNESFISFLFVDSGISAGCKKLVGSGKKCNEIATICTSQEAIPWFESLFSRETPRYNFMPDESALRRRLPKSKVLFENRFPKQSRNVDYEKNTDEFFSSDHIYYSQDGYIGFSDYSVVGDEYSEAGFAPYAVAIHIVYFDQEKNLRVRHFVSDTNDDITDPAGKVSEALGKLVKWNEEMKLDTYAIRAFEKMYKDKSYPGLGTVKKLAIMHHIELMGRYLDEVYEA